MKESIENLRNEINNIDDQILFLISKRFEISKLIGKIKAKNNIPIFQKNRELFIMNKIKIQSEKYKLNEKIFKKIYEVILKQSSELQINNEG